jgi:hypothetical protein
MSTLERTDTAGLDTALPVASDHTSRILRVIPHAVIWTLLIAPMIRATTRGWRPLADDANIAIGAWRTLTLHPPLLGQLTLAGGSANASDPGPLEYWLLGPFVHLDKGQGVLIGSAILCALALSVTIEVLRRTSGTWGAVLFTFVLVDMAIVSPTPFIDPVWNSSFGFFWFVSFLGVAFTVGRGHLRYFPLLVFVGSVTVDSHLLYLPTVGVLLVASLAVGLRTRRPPNLRWLWWTIVIGALCWIGPLYQQFFDKRPNISLLLQPPPKTQGLVFGLHALSRAAALNPIWAAPRPIGEFTSYADLGQRNVVVGLIALVILVAIAIRAWKRKDDALVSMCMVSLGGSVGIVLLFMRTPSNYLLSFIWINLGVWIVGICIWLTIGLAVVTALRPNLAEIRSQVSEVRSQLGREPTRFSGRQRRVATIAALCIAGLVGTLVAVFPYGGQFVFDWPAVGRVKQMTAYIQHRVAHGNVGIGIQYTGSNVFQPTTDAHGVAYLLLTDGWSPGLEPGANQLLGMPIDPKSPFVAFTEHGDRVTAVKYFPVYQPFWFVKGG